MHPKKHLHQALYHTGQLMNTHVQAYSGISLTSQVKYFWICEYAPSLYITVYYLGDDGNERFEHVHFEVGLSGELRKDHVGGCSEVNTFGFDALV